MEEKKHITLIDRIKEWWSEKTSVEVNIMTADAAYSKSTYGETMNANTLIKAQQQHINNLILSKTNGQNEKGNTFVDYFCIYSFPDDVVPYIDKILEAFTTKGYTVINLSERIEEYKNYNVYSISWCKSSL